MGNTGLLRLKAEMALLQPHLGETRRQELVEERRGLPSLKRHLKRFLGFRTLPE